LVLVGIGVLFEVQQADRQAAMEERQQALEDQRAKAEQKLAEQRAQDEALQAYLDQMSTLLLQRRSELLT
jgi:ribosomal protein L9